MAGQASQPQWYLARDGKQHGPISEAELTQFIEQGHLQPNDLVWREGFADWRPAMLVFPPLGSTSAPPHPAPPQRRPMARQADMDLDGGAAGRSYAHGHDDGGGSRFRPGRVVLVLLLLAVFSGGAAFVYLYPERVSRLVASFTASSGTMVIADSKSLDVSPLAGFSGGTAEGIDANLQATALWRVVKREFPEWYKERVDEAAVLARDKKDDAAIGQHMGTKLRELRRQEAATGLQATQQRLKAVAVSFFDNLVQLRAHSPEACHALIVGGEASPTIVGLLQGTKFTAGLQAQLTAMFEAIAEGRKQARYHIRPSRADFQQLADDLKKMGWTQEDMVLFNELRKAPPDKMCQLVHDFFKAQLEVKDPEVQAKLIISALGPVFAD
jgi:uncharacterized protein DUF4339